MNKTSTQCREILRPFLHPPHPQILEKQEVCGTSVQITVPSECSLLLTTSTYYGKVTWMSEVKESLMCPLGDTARNNGKVPEYREMFSQDQDKYWYAGQIPKQLNCPKHFKFDCQLPVPILSKGNFSTVVHSVLGCLSNSDQWDCDCFSKGRVFNQTQF